GFEVKLTGHMLSATMEDWGENWLDVTVDGQTARLDLKPGVNTYPLFVGSAGEHVIRVTRRTGAPTGPTRILEIKGDGPLVPTLAPERRIMVIGDSVTSGYGVEGLDKTCSYSHDTENADLAYPALAAQSFGADLQNISSDGRGLIRNYAGEDPAMDVLTWRVLPDSEAIWQTSLYRPQVIVVNLGANDFDSSDPGDVFDEAYVTMLRRLRRAYPDAEIIGAIGSLLWGQRYTAAKTSISDAVNVLRKEGDTKVQFLEFTPPSQGRRYGCDSHPGMDAQAFMADQLEAAIQKSVGWAPQAKVQPVQVWNGPSAPSAKPVEDKTPPAPPAGQSSLKKIVAKSKD
ncbi:MAG TPA: GDSL-type esterase/lipase family protein, partial [Hyphomonadaceae bacterium]|nr:GDSL-type esterase/lipase family protein [Hyphomonadaceae bacterium]